MDMTCNGFTSQKCPRKLCAPHCRSAGYCSVHKKPIEPAARPFSFVAASTVQVPKSGSSLFQDSTTSDDDALAAGIQLSLQNPSSPMPAPTLTLVPPSAAVESGPSHNTSSNHTPVRSRAPVHSHQMSRVWSQREIQMNNEELARKEREREKAQAHLESKQNLDVLFYDKVSLQQLASCCRSSAVCVCRVVRRVNTTPSKAAPTCLRILTSTLSRCYLDLAATSPLSSTMPSPNSFGRMSVVLIIFSMWTR